MAGSTFGNLFRITTWGESHGKGIGVVVDGCPANVKLSEEDIQLIASTYQNWRQGKEYEDIMTLNEYLNWLSRIATSIEKITLDNGNFIDMDKTLLGIPLLNSYNEELFDEMIDSFNKVDKNILHKISEIRYDTNKRFLLYMNDSIEVYVVLNKIENLNKYNEIVSNLNGDKGILYLDTGNYLEKK